MEEFYKHIKNKMQHPPGEEPDWEMWNGIEAKMARGGRVFPIPVWLWAAGLAILLLGVGYFLGQQRDASERSTPVQAEIQRDTVILREVITQRDTVYLDRLITVTSPNRNSAFQDSPVDGQGAQARIDSLLIQVQTLEDLLTYVPDSVIRMARETQSHEPRNYPPVIALTPHDYASPIAFAFDHDIISKPTDERLDINRIRKKIKQRNIRNSFLPDAFELGLRYGGLGLTYSPELDGGYEGEYGLDAEVIFSENLSLMTGIAYRRFRTEIKDQDLILTYPLPAAYNPEDILRELYITNQYLDIPLSVKYTFGEFGGFRPYANGGVIFSKSLAPNYRFEIITDNGEEYFPGSGVATPFGLNALLVSGGVEYEFIPSLTTYLELRSRTQFALSPGEREKINKVGVQVGVSYRF